MWRSMFEVVEQSCSGLLLPPRKPLVRCDCDEISFDRSQPWCTIWSRKEVMSMAKKRKVAKKSAKKKTAKKKAGRKTKKKTAKKRKKKKLKKR